MHEGVNRRELCRRFGISPQTGYKWLARGLSDVELADRSRRPHSSPLRCDAQIEVAVLAVREAHPAWGARKIFHYLKSEEPPAISTVHAILRRHERLNGQAAAGATAYQRFEKALPNLLWQMDFKGWVELRDRTRCHPLTIIDDHSRYSVCLQACSDQKSLTVQGKLEKTFCCYGLPDAVFVDNGAPWGEASGESWTRLGVWLLKLGVDVLHSRPYHPQSRGKNERFHRTLKAEVFALREFRTMTEVQRAFDEWRIVYNLQRPHQALDHQVPVSRYRPSTRRMPEQLPEVEYDENETVRTVSTTKDYISFKNRLWKVPQAFRGERVAIRARSEDGQYAICFGAREIGRIDLTVGQSVNHVSEQVSTMSPN